MTSSILFLDQQSWRGGGQRVLEEVLDAVREKSFRVIVALPTDGPFAAELRERGVATLTFPLGHYRSGKKSLIESFTFLIRSVFCGFKLALLIRHSNVRLVYVNGPRCLLAGVIAARLTGLPSVFHLHNILTRRAELRLAAAVCRHVQCVLACSQAAANALLSACPSLASRVHVTWNPVRQSSGAESPARATAFFPDSIPEKTIGMVGRITREKGQNVMLRAARHLSWRHKNLRIVFVGAPAPDSKDDAVYLSELQTYALHRCPGVSVCWKGYQSDVRPFIEACCAIVVASTESEGLGLAALEAMAQGVPVVASRVGGIPEFVRDGVNGFLVPAGNGRALAGALDCVLSSAALRERLSQGARATIDERFSPAAFRQFIGNIVADLVFSRNSIKENQANKVEAPA